MEIEAKSMTLIWRKEEVMIQEDIEVWARGHGNQRIFITEIAGLGRKL